VVLPAVLWILAVPAILAGVESLRAGRRQLRYVAAAVSTPTTVWRPPVTLIVPVKGLEPGLAENLRSLAAQDYPDYELIVAARSADDPALSVVRPLLGGRTRLVTAGEDASDTGEKIQNLLAAVAAARPESQVLAFADSDGRVHAGWLRGLIAPLEDYAVGAATGYRWYFPGATAFWPMVRSVWNSTIAGGLGTGRPHFAWGGAMAVRREVFETARVAEFWKGAVSDDYRLTHAMRAAGLEIRFAPQAMVASEGECSGREFLAWATRQMIITRVYSPGLWWTGLAAHVIYCGAMAASVVAAAAGHAWALLVVLLVTLPGMGRGEWRRQAARLMFPDRAQWLDRHKWVYWWLSVPTTWLWLGIFLASACTRRIEWRGHLYELRSPSETCTVEPAGLRTSP
jgi:hypothetical protein